MSTLDDLMVATQHLIGWEDGAEELARLRRCAKKWAHKQWAWTYDEHGAPAGIYCLSSREALSPAGRMLMCGKIGTSKFGWDESTVVHAHDCDAAIILGLEREPA